MARDYFQDITPPSSDAADATSATPHKSIRNITSNNNRPRMTRPPISTNRSRGSSGTGKRGPNLLLWGGAVLTFIAFIFVLATLFMQTKVIVIPREHTVVFDNQTTYTAYPSSSEELVSGDLIYTTETKTFEDSAVVAASGSEDVSVGASGTITIYNNFSASTQRLIKNTRFETPDGKVYRIRGSVVVPGKTSSGPGSIEATVYADQPGEEYNIGPVERFSVPGLKGTPDMYADIYASSAESMTGGFVGTRPSISESAKTDAQAQMESNLKAKVASYYSDTSSNYALVNLAKMSYTPIKTEVSSDGNALVKMSVNVSMPIISRGMLDSFLASETSAVSGISGVRITDTSTFSLVTSGSETGSLGEDPLDFSISGKATFVWDVDTISLANDLAGKNKAVFETIVGGYPSIDSATAKIQPLWSASFPDNPADINIEIKSNSDDK